MASRPGSVDQSINRPSNRPGRSHGSSRRPGVLKTWLRCLLFLAGSHAEVDLVRLEFPIIFFPCAAVVLWHDPATSGFVHQQEAEFAWEEAEAYGDGGGACSAPGPRIAPMGVSLPMLRCGDSIQASQGTKQYLHNPGSTITGKPNTSLLHWWSQV